MEGMGSEGSLRRDDDMPGGGGGGGGGGGSCDFNVMTYGSVASLNANAKPLPMGALGRPATLDETMDAILSRMANGMKITIDPQRRPLLIPGDPLTEMLPDTPLVISTGQNLGEVIDKPNLIKQLGSAEQSVFFLFSAVRTTHFGKNPTYSYFSSNYSVLSLTEHEFDQHNAHNAFTQLTLAKVSAASLPFNICIALYKYRANEILALSDKITNNDPYGFKTQFEALTGLSFPKSEPVKTQAVATVAAATPEVKTPTDIEALKKRLGDIEPEIELGVEALRAKLTVPGASVIQIISDFVKDLPLVAETMTQIISRDQRHSATGEIDLRNRIAEVAKLTQNNLDGLFFDQQTEAKIDTLESAIQNYQPTLIDKFLSLLGRSIPKAKAALQTALAAEEKAYKKAREQEKDRVSGKINDLLTTTQSFQDAAVNRGAIIESQDTICTQTIELLEKASAVVAEVIKDFDKSDKRYGFIMRRITQFQEKIDGIQGQQAINERLLGLELTNTEDMDRLASALVRQLQITQVDDANQARKAGETIVEASEKIGRDLFQQTKSILAEFDRALQVRQAQRQAVFENDFPLAIEDQSGQAAGLALDIETQPATLVPRPR